MTFLDAVPEITEHDGTGGARVWMNRDLMEARYAFQNRNAHGLPSGNHAGMGEIFPPAGAEGYGLLPQDCNALGIPDEMKAHPTSRNMGPKPLGDVSLASSRPGPTEFVPPVGVYDELRFDCDSVQIRHPDGSIDVYSNFYPVFEERYTSGDVAAYPRDTATPNVPSIRKKMLAFLLKTIYPSNENCDPNAAQLDSSCNAIRYRYDNKGRMVGVIDTFGREVLTFDYPDPNSLKIGGMHDFQGRQTTFGYRSDGLLQSITTPYQGTPNQTWIFDYLTTVIPAPAIHLESRSEINSAGVFVLQSMTVRAPANPAGMPMIDARFDTSSVVPQITTAYWGFSRVSDLYLAGGPQGPSLPVDLDGDGAAECLFGGSGKLTQYAYNHTGCYGNNIVTVTDSLGLTCVHTFDWQGRELDRTESWSGGPQNGLRTQYVYEDQNDPSHNRFDPKVRKTIQPRGDAEEALYQSEQDDRAGKSYYMFTDTGEVRRDRFQGGNLLRKTKRPAPDDPNSPPPIIEDWTYEPFRNQVLTHSDGRGYTTTNTYDYQEASTMSLPFFDSVINDWGIDTSGIALGLQNDVNGDGTTNQRVGALIRTSYPACSDANELTVELFGTQLASDLFGHNDAGQLVWKRDPAGRYTSYDYYPLSNPDGSGSGSSSPPFTGYLRSETIDANILNVQGPCLSLTTEYGVDPYGKMTWEKNPKNFYHVCHYDEVNRLVQEEDGAVNSNGVEQTACFTRTKYKYDLNNNKIEESRFNDDSSTTNNDSNYSYVKTRFGYDLLDYPRGVAQELIDPRVPPTPQNPPTWTRIFYHYDGNGKVIKEVSPEGRAKGYTYDPLGRVIKKIAYLTSDSNPDMPTLPGGTTDDPEIRFGYDLNSNLTTATVTGSTRDYVTTLVYDGFNRRAVLKQPPLANGAVMQTEQKFDANSNIVQVTKKGPRGPNDSGQSTLADSFYLYDERNRLYRTEEDYFTLDGSGTKIPLGTAGHNFRVYSETAYDGRSLVIRERDDLGRVKATTYDNAGRTIDEALAPVSPFLQANHTGYTYDANGNVTFETVNAVGKSGTGSSGSEFNEAFITEHVYDALDRKLGDVRRPGGADAYDPNAMQLIAASSMYSSLGDRIGTWNPKLIGTRSYFDTLGREVVTRVGFQGATYNPSSGLIEGIMDPNSQGAIIGVQNTDRYITTKRTFDRDGKVRTQVDDRGKTTTTDYDNAGRIKKVTYADLTHDDLSYFKEGPLRREEHYDAATPGNLLFAVDYTYDEALRKVDALYNLQSTFSHLYGVNHETFAYDGLSRVVTETATSGVPNHPNWSLLSTVQKTYDSKGQVRTDSQSFDTPGGSFSDTVTCDYDTLGNGLSVQAPAYMSSPYSVTNTFDELNRLKTVSRGGVLQHSFEYIGAVHRLRRQVNATNGTTFEAGQTAYDRFSRCRQLRHRKPDASLIAGYDYTYDDVGNELTEVNTVTSANPTSKKFDYDGANRLTQFTVGPPPFNVPATDAFGLDGVGNWISHGAGANPYSNAINSVHEYTTFDQQTPNYDARGNLTGFAGASYVYDAKGRIVAATPSGGQEQYYVYDAEGRRVLAEGWLFTHDGLREIKQTKGVWPLSIVTDFVYGSGLDDVLSFTKSGSNYTLVKNRNGSTRAITDTGGNIVESYDYSPYGELTSGPTTPTCPYLFAGRRRDQKTGLYFMRARSYSATMGRFMSRDPIGVWGDANNCGNPYGYGNDNPLGGWDPLGLGFFGDLWDGACNAVDAGLDATARGIVATTEFLGITDETIATLGGVAQFCDSATGHIPSLLTGTTPTQAVEGGGNPQFNKLLIEIGDAGGKTAALFTATKGVADLTVLGVNALKEAPALVPTIGKTIAGTATVDAAAAANAAAQVAAGSASFAKGSGDSTGKGKASAERGRGESGGQEHTKNARKSTEQKHQDNQAKIRRGRAGESGDSQRRPPRRRPEGHSGPWPPKPKVDKPQAPSKVDKP